MTEDQLILEAVLNTRDFLKSVIDDNASCDWDLARSLGEYLARVDPESLLSRFISTRALRRLGEREAAIRQLTLCKEIIKVQAESLGAEQVLLVQIGAEEALLLGPAADQTSCLAK